MGIFRRKVPIGLIPIHPDNATNKDWLILLEASTIVGPSPERLRVALATQEKKIIKKYNISGKATHYLDVETYNPRIHIPFFCPQLYRHGPDKMLVPLQGNEIGRLVAEAHEGTIKGRRSWYEPLDKLPDPLTASTPVLAEFDTLVVETDTADYGSRNSEAPTAKSVGGT